MRWACKEDFLRENLLLLLLCHIESMSLALTAAGG
jgi:hypothetical protein